MSGGSGNAWAAVGEAASNLASTGMQWIATATQNKKQRKWASKEAEKAYEREKEMWNLQNEYNSPEKQMERYQEAGLNPHLIYGQGNPGNATDMPKYHPAQGQFDVPNLQFPDFINMYYDIKSRKANLDRIEKLNQLTQTQIANLDAERLIKSIQAFRDDAKVFYDYGIRTNSTPINFYPVASDKGFINEDGVIDFRPHPPKIQYDLDLAREKVEQARKGIEEAGSRIDVNVLKKELLNQQAKWARTKNTWFEVDKINIDKDSISDRILQQWLEGLPAGQGFAKTLGAMLLKWLGR